MIDCQGLACQLPRVGRRHSASGNGHLWAGLLEMGVPDMSRDERPLIDIRHRAGKNGQLSRFLGLNESFQ